jgi:hypothetical protein
MVWGLSSNYDFNSYLCIKRVKCNFVSQRGTVVSRVVAVGVIFPREAMYFTPVIRTVVYSRFFLGEGYEPPKYMPHIFMPLNYSYFVINS